MKLLCKDIKEARWAIISIIAYFVIMKTIFHTVCPMVLFTGFPCPACGLTRAGVKLLKLDFSGAFLMHPFIYPIMMLVLCFFVEHYVLLRKEQTISKWFAIIIMVGMIVFYIWRMITQFPDVPPMTYYRHNVIRYLLLFFGVL